MNYDAMVREISGHRHVIVLDYRGKEVTLQTYRDGKKTTTQHRTVEALIGVLNFLSAACDLSEQDEDRELFDESIRPLIELYDGIQGKIAEGN